MKRIELYTLVWEKPMTHVAKRFGISDVALRKICVKHDIPTPPLGYWAKLSNGKTVTRPPLPPLKGEISDAIYLSERPVADRPLSVEQAESRALEHENLDQNKIVVPAEKPHSLHPTALSVERVLKKAKRDHEGFIACSGPGLIDVKIGVSSIERAVVLIDTFFKALKHRSYNIADDEGGVTIAVDDELFRLSIQETRDRTEHQPTTEELKQQRERDSWRARWPDLYSSNSKVYRSWDYFPSGRLSFELFAKGWNRWSKTGLAGRWYDRPTKRAEDYLNASIIALVSTSALIKHENAVAAEEARRREEEALRRRREEARKERDKKRRSFLSKKAEDFAQYLMLSDLANHFKEGRVTDGVEPVDRLMRVLDDLVLEKEQQFRRESLNCEIESLKLFEDDDPV